MVTIFKCPICRKVIRILNDFKDLQQFAKVYTCSCGLDPAKFLWNFEFIKYPDKTFIIPKKAIETWK